MSLLSSSLLGVRGYFHIGNPVLTSPLCEANLEAMPSLHLGSTVSENPWIPGPTLTTFTSPWEAESHGTTCLCFFSPQMKGEPECQLHGCPVLGAGPDVNLKQASKGSSSQSRVSLLHTAIRPFPSRRSESSCSTKGCLRHL